MTALAASLAVAALVAVFLPSPLASLLAVALAVAAALLVEPTVLWRSWTGRSVTLLSLLVVASGALVAAAQGPAAGLAASAGALQRLVVLALVLTLATRRLDTEAVERLAARAGFERLGLVMGLSLNAMPHLAEAWRDAWIAIGARRGRTTPRLSDLPLLVEVMLAHAARSAEQAALAAALRGHPALTGTPGPVRVSPLLVVITGRSGRGKTPAVTTAVEELKRRGVAVVGFQQIPRWRNGRKDGFDIVDLRTNERRVLGRWVGPGQGQHGTPFEFATEGFALARAALRAIPPGAVLVVDEIGAVELRGAGHWPALERALASPRLGAVIVVARRPLVPALLGMLRSPCPVVVDVESEPEPAAAISTILATRLRLGA